MGNTFTTTTAAGETTAQTMVRALTTALAENPVGVTSITIDGQTATYGTRDAMLKELQFWERRVAREAGRRPRVARIDLSGGFST